MIIIHLFYKVESLPEKGKRVSNKEKPDWKIETELRREVEIEDT